MKDLESVTRHMGEGEAVTPAEEVRNIAMTDDAGLVEDADGDLNVGAREMTIAGTRGSGEPLETSPNPWQSLVQVGAQFIAALAAINHGAAATAPWIERDPVTGTQNLKMPLPNPETARQLADALSALADNLRAKIA